MKSCLALSVESRFYVCCSVCWVTLLFTASTAVVDVVLVALVARVARVALVALVEAVALVAAGTAPAGCSVVHLSLIPTAFSLGDVWV